MNYYEINSVEIPAREILPYQIYLDKWIELISELDLIKDLKALIKEASGPSYVISYIILKALVHLLAD